jgi:hypothetical protein
MQFNCSPFGFMTSPLRLAVFMPEFKWDRMNLREIKASIHGIELISVTFDSDLSSFDGILHKFTYQLVDGHEADVERIISYIKTRPGFVVVEPIDRIRIFTDRVVLQDFFNTFSLPSCVEYCDGIPLSPGMVLPSPFPVLVKSRIACGTEDSHFIEVIHNQDQLNKHISEERKLIAFPFVPHFGIVFKVYSLGDHTVFRCAGSLVLHGEEAQAFDSQKPLPTTLQNQEFSADAAQGLQPNAEELEQISRALQSASGVHLIGFDLLRRETDKKLVLVDFNYFPCFRNIDDIPGKLAAFIRKRAGRT